VKYNIIYIDPPWEYKDKALAGNRGAGCKYKTQGLDWIKSLPISDIAGKDCALFLWITMPHLEHIKDVVNAWGFTYKTCAFTWIKKNKKSNTNFWGMGSWTRANPELLILATKGKPSRVSAGVHSVVEALVERHSKKPDIFRKKIIELCGDKPRIEIFAREKYEGWDCIGNEIDGKDVFEAIEELINK